MIVGCSLVKVYCLPLNEVGHDIENYQTNISLSFEAKLRGITAETEAGISITSENKNQLM